MNISVIGAGAIGGNLARLLSEAGHDVVIADARGREAVGQDLTDAGVRAVDLDASVEGANVVIVAIPFGRQPEVADLIAKAPPQAVVVDTANYYPMISGDIGSIDHGEIESLWSQDRLGRPVVKAWNAALAMTQQSKGRPAGSPGRIAIPVAADSSEARLSVMKLVDDTGFEPVDAGVLAESWRLQPGTPAYCTELTADELGRALAAADQAAAPATRDRLMAHFASLEQWPPHDEIVSTNRSAHDTGVTS